MFSLKATLSHTRVLILFSMLLMAEMNVSGERIVCDVSNGNDCKGTTINCLDNEDCTVICQVSDSCTESIINCPNNGDCQVYFESQNSGNDIIINGNSASSLTVISNDFEASIDGIINCPDDNSLNINSITSNDDNIMCKIIADAERSLWQVSVFSTKVFGSVNVDILLISNGLQGFFQSSIVASNVKSIIISSFAKQSFEQATIECASFGDGNCFVDISGDGSLSLQDTTFNSVNGLNKIEVLEINPITLNVGNFNVACGGFFNRDTCIGTFNSDTQCLECIEESTCQRTEECEIKIITPETTNTFSPTEEPTQYPRTV